MKRFFLFLAWLVLCKTMSLAQVSVNQGLPPQIWLNQLMSGGVGKIIDVSIIGKNEQIAWFESQDTSGLFPEDGVLFSTGIAGIFHVWDEGFDFGNSMFVNEIFDLTGSGVSFDPVILTIDFVAATDSINFEFSFASDEFPQYSCLGFDDVAGVFLSGPGINGNLNVSLINPGDYPLGVNSIFCQNAYPFTTFSPYYFFNGMASPFLQRSVAVQPCGVYTVKIILADIEDGIYDSGLFMRKMMHSNTNNILLETDNRVFVEGCDSKPVFIEFDLLPNSGIAHYRIEGTATLGEDYWLNIPAEGDVANNLFGFYPIILTDSIADEFETIDIHFYGNDCFESYLRFFITDLLPIDTVVCHDDTIPAFGLPSPVEYAFTNSDVPDYYSNQTLTLPLEVNGVPFDYLYTTNMIKEICLEYTGLIDEAPAIYVLSPNNALLRLTRQTVFPQAGKICFTPGALVPISSVASGSGPDFGDFKPEGDWADLGGDINGIWTLIWSREVNFPNIADLKWHIVFSKEFLYDEFQYEWSNGAVDWSVPVSTDSAQVYSVHFYNDLNDCTKEVVATPILVEITEIAPVLCAGDSLIYNGVVFDENHPSGEVELQNVYGCDSIIQVNLSFYPTPNTLVNDTLCEDEILVIGKVVFDINNPNGTLTFQNPTNGCDSIVTVDLEFHESQVDTFEAEINAGEFVAIGVDTFTEAGEYTVILEDSHGCDSTIFLKLGVLSGSTEGTVNDEVNIFPNPASKQVMVRAVGNIHVFDIQVYNPVAQLVYQRGSPCADCTVPVADLPAGIYIVAIHASNGVLFKKIEVAR